MSAEKVYKTWARIAAVFAGHGIEHAVLCPGSRSAPVALSLLRETRIKCFVVPDERSAGFIALGLAQKTQKPVLLACTSGTAAVNFYPAVAEAHFQEVPLVVLTSDRPPEWIAQADNQAIHQQNLYGKHAHFLQMPDSYESDVQQWHALRLANEAVLVASGLKKQPVQVNVPLREPLYLSKTVEADLQNLPVIKSTTTKTAVADIDSFRKKVHKAKNILVVAGLQPPNRALQKSLQAFLNETGVTFFPDVASNLLEIEGAVLNHDLLLSTTAADELPRPDLLITFGGPVVSKPLKKWLRQVKPEHWHIHPAGQVVDTFQSLQQIITAKPVEFFDQITQNSSSKKSSQTQWQQLSEKSSQKLQQEINSRAWDELIATHQILQHLPQNSILHLGNSMPVRLVSLAGMDIINQKQIEVYSNRGTSGIDGSLSTAVGAALATDKTVTALIGDLSFFYDRNGLWHQHLPQNLRIIILNNNGGGIFRNIPGPQQQSELEQYFTSPQNITAEQTALQHGCDYHSANNLEEIKAAMANFYPLNQVTLLEVKLPSENNSMRFK